MNKIIVIGCPGAGKTHFAKKLGERLHIQVHHLDTYFWKENRTEMNEVEFLKIQNELMEKDQWIIDGNFTKSMEHRMSKADTIIFLDYPKRIVLWRFLKRYFKFFNKVRPEMGGNNKEVLQWSFIKFILKYPTGKVYEKIERHSKGKNVVVLHNPKETAQFLKNQTIS